MQAEARFQALMQSCGHLVAIERPGPAFDDCFYTMRAMDMTPVLAPLHRCVLEVWFIYKHKIACFYTIRALVNLKFHFSPLYRLVTEGTAESTGIGDGGNEVSRPG